MLFAAASELATAFANGELSLLWNSLGNGLTVFLIHNITAEE